MFGVNFKNKLNSKFRIYKKKYTQNLNLNCELHFHTNINYISCGFQRVDEVDLNRFLYFYKSTNKIHIESQFEL